jgi:hypothetical protein
VPLLDFTAARPVFGFGLGYQRRDPLEKLGRRLDTPALVSALQDLYGIVTKYGCFTGRLMYMRLSHKNSNN